MIHQECTQTSIAYKLPGLTYPLGVMQEGYREFKILKIYISMRDDRDSALSEANLYL